MARLFYNPHVYDKLVQEIRSTFNSEDQINHDKILQMPYLNAVVWEGLRIHPPVPAGNLRMVPPGGDTVDGWAIPAGTTVSVGSWSASHNPRNFRNPDDFIPERWIGDEYASDVKDAMQPFSLGPRNCLGKKWVCPNLYTFLLTVLVWLCSSSALLSSTSCGTWISVAWTVPLPGILQEMPTISVLSWYGISLL